jgi:hypothetical protein
MTTFILDTLEYATRLKAGGYTEQQAETSARALADVFEKQTVNKAEVFQHEENLRHDLRETELKLEARIREAELKLEARISETKAELTRWVVGVGVLQTTVIIGVLMKVAKLI